MKTLCIVLSTLATILLLVAETLAQPNLVVSQLAINPPNLNPGRNLTITPTITNIGNANSAASFAGIYWSTNQALDGNDFRLVTMDVPALNPRASFRQNNECRIPNRLFAGQYFIIVKADVDNRVRESNENDNLRAAAVNVIGQPNLRMTAASGNPVRLRANQRTQISYTEWNNGVTNAPAHTVGFYWSTDIRWDPNEDRNLGDYNEEARPAGTSRMRYPAVERIVPANARPGRYYLIVVPDNNRRIAESDENDNDDRWIVYDIIAGSPPKPNDPHFPAMMENPMPAELSLSEAYPNPFNSSTQFTFALPIASPARVEIYNVSGNSIATLLSGELAAGYHTLTWNAATHPAGLYFLRAESGNWSATKRLLLIK